MSDMVCCIRKSRNSFSSKISTYLVWLTMNGIVARYWLFKWKLLLSICWIYIYRYKIWNFFKLPNHFISVLKYGWMVTVFVSMGQGSVVPDVLSNTEADSWSSVAPGTDSDTLRTAHAARDSLTPRRPPGLCNKISTCKVPYFGTTLQFCLSHLY